MVNLNIHGKWWFILWCKLTSLNDDSPSRDFKSSQGSAGCLQKTKARELQRNCWLSQFSHNQINPNHIILNILDCFYRRWMKMVCSFNPAALYILFELDIFEVCRHARGDPSPPAASLHGCHISQLKIQDSHSASASDCALESASGRKTWKRQAGSSHVKPSSGFGVHTSFTWCILILTAILVDSFHCGKVWQGLGDNRWWQVYENSEQSFLEGFIYIQSTDVAHNLSCV